MVALWCFIWAVCLSVVSPEPYYLSNHGGNRTLIKGELRKDEVSEWTAVADYEPTLNKTGWDMLDLQTNSKFPDEVQMYDAGVLEGYLTYKSIYFMWHNNVKDYCINKTKACTRVDKFVHVNWNITKAYAEKNLQDPYWYHVYLSYQQIEGMYYGYKTACRDYNVTKPILEAYDILKLNLMMDIEADLIFAFKNETEKDFKKHVGHCSALVKLLPDFSNVFFGHNTWSGYSTMNRIFKKYYFPLRKFKGSDELIPGVEMKFSSYPGIVSSVDDFYVISSGLATMETTNNVFDHSIYSHVVAESVVFEGIRSMLANRLASNCSEWVTYFSKKNSGTYNNQWMIIDLNKFEPGFQPKSDFFWVVEQMPGLIVAHDQTNLIIGEGYFASYNIPFYDKIYNYSGIARFNQKYLHMMRNYTMLSLYSNPFSHSRCSRARIFKREQDKVRDLKSMYALMRLNKYHNDFYSACPFSKPSQNPSESISARGDLFPENGKSKFPCPGFNFFGATDVKISSYLMFLRGEEVLAASGPSTSGDTLPYFEWDKSKVKYKYHLGQPMLWNFYPMLITNGTNSKIWKPDDIDGRKGARASGDTFYPTYLIIIFTFVLQFFI